VTFAVSDHALQRQLSTLCRDLDIEWEVVGDPGFMHTAKCFEDYAHGKRTLRMADFYKQQRETLQLLLDDDGQPQGGRWSFDENNRRKLPRKQSVPALPEAAHGAITTAALQEITSDFADLPGDAGDLWVPTTRKQALAWLAHFTEQRLVGFGTFEDAITTRSATLFHSMLSPLLNLGLLTPREVVDAVLTHADNHDVPLNDLEGFIRQIIGWREFVRGVYLCRGEEMRRRNARSQRRQLTHHWHDATTGIPPLDAAIDHQLRLGWNHHINRLMVIANLMNLSEIEPGTVYEYFMTYYIDAYDWVMVPNVFGMGLNSEGGVFATKPYICGSNYLLKMSDFGRGDWCDVVDGLYWRFIENNLDELKRNQRLAMFASALHRLAADKRQRIFSAADAFLDRCTRAAP